MKKIMIFCSIGFLIPQFMIAQNRISLNFGCGYFFYNSENSMQVMGDKKFDSHLIFGFDFTRNNILGMDLTAEYSYSHVKKENTLVAHITAPVNSNVIAAYGSDVILNQHSIDLSNRYSPTKILSLGIGPSLVFVDRIIEMTVPPVEGSVYQKKLYDKLASAGIGLNGYVEFSYPLTESEQYFFISSKLKVRYSHSIWFDEEGRKLDSYQQEFIDAQIVIGIGYSFN